MGTLAMSVSGLVVAAALVATTTAEYCQERYGDATTQSGEEEKSSTDVTGWIIGILLCIGSAFASVVGVTFQKKAHMRNDALPEDKRKPYIALPTWWIGITGVIAGALMDFLSLGYAPQTVVASLGSMTLVINAIVAPFALGERVSRLELLGTFTITIGAAVAVGSSSQKSQEYNLDILKCLYRQDGFVAYACLVVVWCLGLVQLFRMAESREKLDDPLRYYPHWAKIHPFSITALSGTLGAQSLLFAKSVSIILRGVYAPSEGSDGGKAFAKFETYLIIVAMIFTILTQTHTLNMALQRFDSVVVLPLFQVFWILMGCFGAGSYFKEFDGVAVHSAVLFPVGICIITAGIAVLSRRHTPSEFEHMLDGKPPPPKPKHLESMEEVFGPDSPSVSSAQPLTPERERGRVEGGRASSRAGLVAPVDPHSMLHLPAGLSAARRLSSLVPSFSGALVTATLKIDEPDTFKAERQRRMTNRKMLEQRYSVQVHGGLPPLGVRHQHHRISHVSDHGEIELGQTDPRASDRLSRVDPIAEE